MRGSCRLIIHRQHPWGARVTSPPVPGLHCAALRGSLCATGAWGRPPPSGGQSGAGAGAGGRYTPCQTRHCFPGPGDAPAGCGSHASAGRAPEQPSQECIIDDYLGRRVLGRAEEQMAAAFNAHPPSSICSLAVCSRWPLPHNKAATSFPPCHLLQQDRPLFSARIYC